MKITDKKNIEDILPLTPMQQGMLFHYLKEPESDYYLEQLCLTITGELDLTRFRQAWARVLETNEMLRTRFIWESVTKPLQVVLKNSSLQFTFHDFSNGKRSENDKRNLVHEIKDNDRKNRFNLNSIPFRIMLCKLAQAQYEIIISNHHILYDGWSNGILLKEFFLFYHQLAQKKSPQKPYKHKYKEYINWIQDQDVQKQREYWTRCLRGFDTKSELSIKRTKGKNISTIVTGNSHYKINFSKAEREKIEIFTKSHKLTLACLLYSAWGILLQRYNNSEDVIFGTTVSGRSANVKGIEDIVGLFINTVPMRVRTDSTGHENIKDFLSRVNQELQEREAYESASLVEIKEYGEVGFVGELFDTILVIENYPLDKVSLERYSPLSLSVDSYSLFETTHYDLTVGITLFEDIKVEFTYNEDLFDETVIEGLSRHFVKIVEDMVDHPGKELAALEILSEAEKNKILFEFNNTTADYPGDKTIQQLFARQVERIPDHIALVGQILDAFGGLAAPDDSAVLPVQHVLPVQLTYRQVNERSGKLAGLLIEAGVQPDTIVGIMIERSVEMIIGILGILKAGGAYLPIDPDYPEERINFMLKDSGARVLVSESSELSKLSEVSGGIEIIDLHQSKSKKDFPTNLTHLTQLTQLNLAYIIYTSGTTGNPKGVAVEHTQVVNFLYHMYKRYDREVGEADRCLGVTNIMFDVSVWECFLPLSFGAGLVVLPGLEKFDVIALSGIIIREQITLIYLPPALLEDVCRQMRKQPVMIGLNKMLVGVEPIRDEVLAGYMQLNPGMKIINGYGPTETTICATTYNYCPHQPTGEIVPIGAPLANTRVILKDAAGRMVPQGIPGEICISGAGTARGYLNNPELTAQSFRLYRSYQSNKSYILYYTGDLARWLSDGNIQFLGRRDTQVKIRGYRIELGEIEKRLSKIRGVKNAVVVVRGEESQDKYLCAYVAAAGELDISELRERLAEELPDYMIPAYFMPIEKIPLTSSGKVDRKALPKPELKIGESCAAPGDTIEKKLVEIWAEVLGRDELHASQMQTSIGIHDNFFRLGGHSLKAANLAAKIHKVFDVKVPLSEIFRKPSIRELAKYIDGKRKNLYKSIRPTEEKEYYELSPAQKRLYLLQQLVMESTGYNMPFVMPLGEGTGKEKLEIVFKRLIQRHESLRTSFITVNEEPYQRVEPEVDFIIGYDEAAEETGIEMIKAGFTRPFKLDAAPLLRVNFIKAGPTRYLFIDMHHIITDGTSQAILEKEFRGLLEGEEPGPLQLRYKDYSEWYNRTIRQGGIKQQESFWKKEFPGEIPVLNLTTDYPRPKMQMMEGNEVSFSINREETAIVKRIAAENNSTLYMCLLAIFNVLLSKLSGQEDIIIGTPAAARRHNDLQEVIGMLVNTLAMRNYPAGDKSFREFLKEVNRRTLEVYENQEYPFEMLVEKIAVSRDTSRNPVFDVMFNMLNQEGYKGEDLIQDEQATRRHRKATSKFDMNLTAVEIEERLFFTWEYSTRLYQPATIDRLIGYFKNIVKGLARGTGERISALDIMDKEEVELLLRLSRGEAGDHDGKKTVCRWYEDQAEKTPDNIAIISNYPWVTELSYKELNKKSSQLAGLLTGKGVKPETIVGIMVERSLEMIIGILGILKAGGAYLPVDPEYPRERQGYMLEDGEVRWLLINNDINGNNRDIFQRLELIDMRREQSYNRINNKPGNSGAGAGLVYVIYTSGSTGRPKGVMLEHPNLVNLIRYQYQSTGIDFSRVLQFTTISFDVSAQEIFSALLAGGRLYLVKNETRTHIPALFKFIEENDISTVFLPASFLRAIFKEEEYVNLIPRSIGHIVTAGEQVVITDKFRKYLIGRKVNLHNHYGPSETHVVTALTLDPGEEIVELPSIGKPVMNTAIYIMDKWGKLLPAGVVGEICIAGAQVGRGYLNRPQLTAERYCLRRPGGLFLKKPPPWTPRKNFPLHRSYLSYRSYISYLSYFYRTGDLARYLPGGNIEFLGRIDHQVKVRGYRVEPGEIESRIMKYPGIKEVVVLVREEENRDKYICAYVVTEAGYSQSGLREFLTRELPGYMIPSYFVRLEQIPLTPNGKIDRGALPGPGLRTGESYTAPRDEIEKRLARLWAGVLGGDERQGSQIQASPGIDDNFFQRGGHSLSASILVSRIEKAFDVKVPLAEIFNKPRIRELAGYIKEAVQRKYEAIEIEEKKKYYALSSAQKRLYFLQQMDKDGTAYNISSAWVLEGIIDKPLLEQSIAKLMRRHESFRTSFLVVNEDPVQVIYDEVEFEIEYKEVEVENNEVEVKVEDGDTEGTRGLAPLFIEPATRDSQPVSASISSFIRPFDISHPPLLRVGLAKLEEEKHMLLVDMHHIISDGVSIQVLVEDFSVLYPGKELPGIKLQYKDYAQWQNRERESTKIREQGKYWKKEYKGEIPVLELPVDKARPNEQSFEGETINFQVNSEITRALKALAFEGGATLYIVLQALYTVFLSKLSGQEDIVVGTPIAGRRHADLEKIIGMFVNTLAIRNYPNGEKKFTRYLDEVKERTLKAFENQDYLYEDLLENVSIKRDVSRNPLFDTMFALQNIGRQKIHIPGMKVIHHENENKTSRFDLTLTAEEQEERLLFTFEYSTKLFKRETIHRFISYFKNLLAGVSADKNRELSGLNIISAEETHRLIYEFNAVESDYPKEKTITELFAGQEERTPDKTVLYGRMMARNQEKEGFITYKGLNEKSGRLAGELKQRGVEPDTIVGIMVGRTVEMIIGIMGILTAGGAYLPIDPDYPKERIDYMLKDSSARILVSGVSEVSEVSEDIEIIDLHRIKFKGDFLTHLTQHTHLAQLNLAYIIYTSGTTGRPNGVMVAHRSLVNLCCWHNTFYSVTSRDRATKYAGIGFDASVWEIFPYLVAGACLYIVPEEILLELEALNGYIERNGITISFLPTRIYEQYQELDNQSLRILLTGGDKLRKYKKRNYHLYNNYGPTENTVVTTSYPVREESANIPIGKPVFNNRVYILDSQRCLQPVGVTGELYVGGDSQAQGYLNKPELTFEKFDQDLWDYQDYHDEEAPFGRIINAFGEKEAHELHKLTRINEKLLRGVPDASRGGFLEKSPPGRRRQNLYKTGDLVRWLEDGNIEYRGRIDSQVKIRGYRIERGEIENRLTSHENVKEAVVIDRTDSSGENYLCAYIVVREPAGAGHRELKVYLSQILPQYMIPAHILEVEQIPLNPNGKVDRNALPEPGAGPASEYTAPETDNEREIAEIWKRVLGLEQVSINDNFFDVGGNSLKIIKLVMEIKKHLREELPTAKMFQYTTIAAQARYIDQAHENRGEDVKVQYEAEKVKNKLKQRQNKMRR